MIDGEARTGQDTTFEAFFRAAEPLLSRALAAGFGFDLGRDATAEALGHAWRRWDRVAGMENPTGYLYRVGENWARRQLGRRTPSFAEATGAEPAAFEPALGPALAALPVRQRQAVVLVAGYGLTHREAADLLGIARSSIQNHVERGMAQLRRTIGVDR